ncbi:hypothetical protein McanMca71_004494 [Microsporum canis]
MVIHIQPYDSSRFNSLPSLYDAGSVFDTINGNKFIEEVMKPLFKTYGVERSLGLALMHSHFQLEENEKLVDIRGTSVPWTGSGENPTVWHLADNVLRPYEFSLSSHIKTPDRKSSNYQGFLMAFRDALGSVGAQRILGFANTPVMTSRAALKRPSAEQM